jgi:hypothetical protein
MKCNNELYEVSQIPPATVPARERGRIKVNGVLHFSLDFVFE